MLVKIKQVVQQVISELGQWFNNLGNIKIQCLRIIKAVQEPITAELIADITALFIEHRTKHLTVTPATTAGQTAATTTTALIAYFTFLLPEDSCITWNSIEWSKI